MQNSQEINWLSVLAPSLIVGTLAIVGQIIATFWLSKRTADYQKMISEKLEDYKKDISKELENYKLQLQSDFQMRFYKFQTKFSLYHQKKVEATENLFSLLATLQNDLQILMNWENYKWKGTETKKERFNKTLNDLNELCEYHDTKRIYFDKEVSEQVIKMIEIINFVDAGINSDENSSEINKNLESLAKNVLESYIPQTMKKLEDKCRQMLSAEKSNI